ncbi:E3 ubiquitin-protein ligase ORTHRUS 2-like [Coffea eugenioides]|uniref:E3 ubiquitin-protein ligase ORTHRUS 2-like n=1 Tax=Coffea eugenioides TaxID=49369 RepID=UPI000F6047B1|nr:E3 ubiquitin-protein ligase ORTHRUS 2-like [Coffea eugenioides]
MTQVSSGLPCDGDGLCMVCKTKPPPHDTLTCKTCITPWHLPCLSSDRRPESMASAALWDCPDCDQQEQQQPVSSLVPPPRADASSADLIAAIRAIQADPSLSDHEKAKRRQQLLSGESSHVVPDCNDDGERSKSNEVLDLLDQKLYCSICMQLPDRPVTTPCGHNFCLKCFQKWVSQGKHTCANCRNAIPAKMAREPRINSALVFAIRTAKMFNSSAPGGLPKVAHFIHNQSRPDKAFVTERAKKSGKANACSGKIFVTIPHDHFGPIPPENDPERNQGVMVGETWEDRMECRQWGAHFPHVAGIAGQSDYGAQSVALSGGYEDDEDHGEWFLYTGSGGRDLSGNKRTNKTQSFDQKFDKLNEALRVSCRKGYPVRVVRSHKEKRSSYAPEKGVRYDGVYRIEQCWRKVGKQGFLMCRYLFVRCDNEPAPWTSESHGDRPRPLPSIKELKDAPDITTRKGTPAWDYDEKRCCWMWKKPPPDSRVQVDDDCDEEGNKTRKVRRQKKLSVKERLLKEFGCLICHKVMVDPLTTPCAHNFCKACLEGAFAGQSFIRQRTCEGRRTLRAQKNIMKCPSCKNDISEFLRNPQVNRELMDVIESLKHEIEEDNVECGEQIDDCKEDTEAALSEDADVRVTSLDLIEEAEGTDAKLDMLAGDKENCDVNSGGLEVVKDKTEGIVKSLNDSKSREKLKKASNAEISPNKFIDKSEAAKSKLAKSKLSEGKTRNKRKTGDGNVSASLDGGVKTRSKRSKAGPDEDNCA